MNFPLLIGVAGMVIATAGTVIAFLAWRYPRAAAPGSSAEDQARTKEERDEGLALALGLLWIALKRRKAAAQESARPN